MTYNHSLASSYHSSHSSWLEVGLRVAAEMKPSWPGQCGYYWGTISLSDQIQTVVIPGGWVVGRLGGLRLQSSLAEAIGNDS